VSERNYNDRLGVVGHRGGYGYDVIKEAIGQQAIASIKTNWPCDTMKMEIPWCFLTQRILGQAKRKTFYGPQINLPADILIK